MQILNQYWSVLALFVIPIGGGIPAGVILAQKLGIPWFMTSFLYLLSDLLLACVFEPLMLLFIKHSKSSPFIARLKAAFEKSKDLLMQRYGLHPTPFSLIMLTFGSDPMTGRSVTKALGHGFLKGWSLVITGDMFFFWVIMGSTLWLNNILGDGTLTAIIITLFILFLPGAINKWRKNRTE